MSRVAGSYESIIRGVSQQVPQDRRPGQHYDQVNMISDPVRGLARRHGSEMMAEIIAGTNTTAMATITADTAGHKVYPFSANGLAYDLIFRTRAPQVQADGYFGFVYSKNEKKFIPLFINRSTSMTAALLDKGAAAVTSVGDYLLLAPNGTVSSAGGDDRFASTKHTLVAWVRSGAYSRRYRVTLPRAVGPAITVEYTTPPSSYPVVLDTSDIPVTSTDGTGASDYQKRVNDRVNAYNSAVTKYIGDAAAAVTPAAIANELHNRIVAATAGTGLRSAVVDSTIVMATDTMADPITEVSCEDGGDGTTFRGVGNEIPAAELVSSIHFPGKVVKVRPKKNAGQDAYYLQADPKIPGNTDWGEVTWREAAGFVSSSLNCWCMGGFGLVGGVKTFVIGGSNTDLQAKANLANPVPGLVQSRSGDRTSNPNPAFQGKQITYLGMFQDRLLVASGSTLTFSKSGDYQNFYRDSVLTLDDDDPVEMYALGAEYDVISAGTTYDRNLLLFGKRKQYVVSGRQPLTPRNASVVVQSSHEDAVDAPPISSGNFVFYTKYRNGIASAHQVQIGQLADTPESYEVSKQLDRYLLGRPAEIVATTAPNVLLLRTESQRNSLYVYTYLDSAAGSERLFDSWSRWDTAPETGVIMGLSRYEGDILAYYIRIGRGPNDPANRVFAVCDRFVLDTARSMYPYIDSRRSAAGIVGNPVSSLSLQFPNIENATAAFDDTSPNSMFGTNYADVANLTAQLPSVNNGTLWVGWNSSAYVTPTNPYMLDMNGKAIVTGRLTVVRAVVSIADSGGMKATLKSRNGESVPVDFTGRLVGSPTNRVQVTPIVTTTVSVPLGREVRDFTYTLNARKWLPLTITAIEWSGQFFNNTRR